jgi:hypothetical protein
MLLCALSFIPSKMRTIIFYICRWIHIPLDSLCNVILTKLTWFRKRIWKAVLGKVFHLSIREFVISHQEAKPRFIQDGSIQGSDVKNLSVCNFYFVGLSVKLIKTVLCSTSVSLLYADNFSFSIFFLAYRLSYLPDKSRYMCVRACVLPRHGARHSFQTRIKKRKFCT